MAYIAVASAKGSPGVTTAVAALAATWPADRDLLVAELDPAGGDLVVRFDLATEPGLVTLAAAGRRELASDTVLAHTQPLPVAAEGDGQTPTRRALLAPVSGEQASASLSALRGGLARALSGLPLDVLVDCGRLDPSSTTYDLASNADLLVVVTRPVVAEVHHLSSRLMALKPAALSLLMIGDRPYSVTDVARAVGATALGTLPVDPRAAAVLTEGHPNAVRLLRRSRLLRDARPIAEALAGWLAPVAEAPVTAAGAPGQAVPVAPPPLTAEQPAPPSPPPSPPVAPPAPSFEPPPAPGPLASPEVAPVGESGPSFEPVLSYEPVPVTEAVPPFDAPPAHSWGASYAPPPSGPAYALPPPPGSAPDTPPRPDGVGPSSAPLPPPTGAVSRLRSGGRGSGRDKTPKHFRRDDEGRR